MPAPYTSPIRRKYDVIVSLSAGLLIGSAFIDALPEVTEGYGASISILTFVGGVFLWWAQKNTLNLLARKDYSPLVGTALFTHTIAEGVAGGILFGFSHSFGLAILGALLLHHLPEFIASVYLMRDAGSSPEITLIVPLTSIALLLFTYIISSIFLIEFQTFPSFLAGITGGAFFYVGLRSWWPRRREETFIFLVLGILLYAFYIRLTPLLF